MRGIPEEVKVQALRRFVRGSGDVGAALWCDVSEPGRAGRAFRTVITDGESFEIVDWVDAEAPRADLLSGPIETAVEKRIRALCPQGNRIPMLRAFGLWFDEGRIPIRLGPGVVPVPPSEATTTKPRAA